MKAVEESAVHFCVPYLITETASAQQSGPWIHHPGGGRLCHYVANSEHSSLASARDSKHCSMPRCDGSRQSERYILTLHENHDSSQSIQVYMWLHTVIHICMVHW